MKIETIQALKINDLQPLLDSSLAEGYTFIKRLWDEYHSGVSTFDTRAILLGIKFSDRLIAIGGIHQDPYLHSENIGRIRHVYVIPDYRRQGIGKQLVMTLIQKGEQYFNVFTLRTLTYHGSKFYEALGFSNEMRYPNATHWVIRPNA